MRIFLDTNVLLDLVQDRVGAEDARRIIGISQENAWTRLYVSYLSMANIACIIRKNGTEAIKACLSSLCKFCEVLPMNDMQLMTAIRNCDSPDFEDALQIICAEEKGCDVIITTDTSHFRSHTDIPVLSPAEFLSHCTDASAH